MRERQKSFMNAMVYSDEYDGSKPAKPTIINRTQSRARMVGPEALTKTSQNNDLERLTLYKSTVEFLRFLTAVV